MATARHVLATSAAAALLAAAGVGLAPGSVTAARVSLRDTFAGTVEMAASDAFVVERRQRDGTSVLIAVDTGLDTVVSRDGQQRPLADVRPGATVIVSGTQTPEGVVRASRIVIRPPAA
jgi:hypothetical protein